MLAVIRTGGKQYIVSPGDKIKIDPPALLRQPAVDTVFLAGEALRAGKIEGEKIIFDQVLLFEKEGKLEIGDPLVKGAEVIGKVLKQGKSKKVIVFKYKPKTRYKIKKGHRQPYTEIEILDIRY